MILDFVGEILAYFLVLSIIIGFSVAFGPGIIRKIKLIRKKTKGSLITKKNLSYASKEEINSFAKDVIND